MSTSFKDNFLWNFKLSDNIVFTLKSVTEIYNLLIQDDKKIFLIKPLVILNTSIIEALLFDFISNRIKGSKSKEEVGSLGKISNDVISSLKNKTTDKFTVLIDQVEKYNLFEKEIYKKLKILKNIRNRIHIQNKNNIDDAYYFNKNNKKISEETLSYILDFLSQNQRPKGVNSSNEFILPW